MAERSYQYEGLHRSPSPDLKEVTTAGIFGGIFAGPRAGMYGKYLYRVLSPKHLTDFELNYEIEDSWKIALELCDDDAELAEIIMTPECNTPDPEDEYEAQALRGKLAFVLGYTSIEMRDETGYSALCLPGCLVEGPL